MEIDINRPEINLRLRCNSEVMEICKHYDCGLDDMPFNDLMAYLDYGTKKGVMSVRYFDWKDDEVWKKHKKDFIRICDGNGYELGMEKTFSVDEFVKLRQQEIKKQKDDFHSAYKLLTGKEPVESKFYGKEQDFYDLKPKEKFDYFYNENSNNMFEVIKNVAKIKQEADEKHNGVVSQDLKKLYFSEAKKALKVANFKGKFLTEKLFENDPTKDFKAFKKSEKTTNKNNDKGLGF